MALPPRPKHVGILAMEAYFPSRFVAQTDLETADGCPGKYTSGLGQQKIAFVDDREDIGSILLSAFSALLDKYGLDPKSIGRLEVGTETLVDKSKSVKTTLLRLLGPNNANVEGVTSTNACYGGTAALLNSVAWVQSEAWDGRYAVVLCGDIAVYQTPPGQKCGSARATQGCGAVAMLIGPDAPLALEVPRASHAMDVWDFYKPHHSEFAEVDGAMSQTCYLQSVDECYRGYQARAARHFGGKPVTVDWFDHLCFHSPYHKLVSKGFARLLYIDFRAASGGAEDFLDETNADEAAALSKAAQLAAATVCPEDEKLASLLLPFATDKLEYEASLEDRGLDAALRKVGAAKFKAKTGPSSRASIEVGNTYTGAVFVNLLSLVCHAETTELEGQRIGLFSYGSGSVATLYSIAARSPESSPFSLERIKATVKLEERLRARKQATVEEFTAAMELRAVRYGTCGYEPTGPVANVAPGSFYLAAINEKHHRAYEKA